MTYEEERLLELKSDLAKLFEISAFLENLKSSGSAIPGELNVDAAIEQNNQQIAEKAEKFYEAFKQLGK